MHFKPVDITALPLAGSPLRHRLLAQHPRVQCEHCCGGLAAVTPCGRA